MARRAENGRANEWRQRFERQRVSGKSVASFCRNEEVSVASFYQWRKKLAALDESQLRVDRRSDFAAVQLVGSAHVAVHLPGGTCLNIPMADSRAFEVALDLVVTADAERARGETC